MTSSQTRELRSLLQSGDAMLFTGAGFSSAASDHAGRPIPTSEEITQELWTLCFPDEAQDESSLTDLFHHAARHCPDELDRLLKARLCVSPRSLPEFYRFWFAVPWRRAWTLNVDDVEHAAAQRFGLLRPIESISTLVARFEKRLLDTDALAFLHLNGSIEDGVEHVTFSTTQYGDRLARHDLWYEQFVDDLVNHPFVIVGTRLEEAPFWQNLHATYGPEVGRSLEVRRAFIVSPKLSRARRELLADLGIEWIPLSAEDFARSVLDLGPAPKRFERPMNALH